MSKSAEQTKEQKGPPPLPPALAEKINAAEAAVKAGKLSEAEALCNEVLAATADQPNAMLILSVIYTKTQRWAQAEALLRRGFDLYTDSIGFALNLAQIYMLQSRTHMAFVPMERVVFLVPDMQAHRNLLVTLYSNQTFKGFNEKSKDVMLRCLRDDNLPHSYYMSGAWLSLFLQDPQSKEFLRLCASKNYEDFCKKISPEILSAIQEHELLLSAMKRLFLKHPLIEYGLTWLRRWFLDAVRGGEDVGAFLPLLSVLSRYCFMNEYAFGVTEEESNLVSSLPGRKDPAAIAVRGCYMPLWQQGDAHDFIAVAQDCADEEFCALVRAQVQDPLEEQEIKSSIKSLSPITGAVSQAVQSQYEENPYPRWVSIGVSPIPDPVKEMARGKHILIAGCGTGREAAEIALLYPCAQVTAVDLSRSSIAYGIRKTKEMGIENVNFMQANILELRQMGCEFDFIISSGVLHHMEKPEEGWRVLYDILKPEGVMKIALYSTIGRRFIKEARDMIAEQNIPHTAAGIRAFRKQVMALDENDPLRRTLTAINDFYALSPCRDLLFHVQEHTYTLPEIRDIYEPMDLTPFKLDIKNPKYLEAFNRMFPQDQGKIDVDHWHSFEQQNPAVFAAMITMWFGRKESLDRLDYNWIRAAIRA